MSAAQPVAFPEELVPLWTALEELLLAYDEILDRLDPPGLPENAARLKPLNGVLAERIAAVEGGPGAPGAKDLDEAGRTLLRGANQVLQSAQRFETAGDGGPHAIMKAFQALRPLSRGREILFGLVDRAPVSRYYLDPSLRQREDLLQRLAAARANEAGEADEPARGLTHVENAYGKRGGYSLYVPETYTPERKWPMVVALHGGSGHGADFLWNWLPAARGFEFILVAATSRGRTWSLQQPGLDAANLNYMLSRVSETYRIDTERMLLTGISDGGTYASLLSVVPQAPFTHYAPVAAAAHVLINKEGAIAAPVAGKRYYLVHGGRDWMFPVARARRTAEVLRQAGAEVEYREIEDLSHNYPGDENARLVEWFCSGRGE